MHSFVRFLIVAFLLAVVAHPAAHAARYPPQKDYAAFHAAFAEPALDPSQTMAVENRVIVRGPARFELKSGQLFLARPVGGRTCVAVFTGAARFCFTAPEGRERIELSRRTGADSVVRDCRAIAFVFADSTPAELARFGSFGPGAQSKAAKDALTSCFRYIGEPKTRYLDAGLARAFLEGRESGHFMAYVPFAESDRMLFELDPSLVDGALLWREAKRHRIGFTRAYPLELVCQFAPDPMARESASLDSTQAESFVHEPAFEARRYSIDVTITREMKFRAVATLDCEAREDSARWFALEVFRDLVTDSVRWDGEERAAVYKHPRGSQLWLRSDRPLRRGERRSLRIGYHGALLENTGDWLFVRSAHDWYPRVVRGRDAQFDVTYHVPDELLIVGTGVRAESGEDHGMRHERWVTETPVVGASFIIGRFREMLLRPDAPRPITALVFTGSPGRFVIERGMPDGTTRQTLFQPNTDERVLEEMAQVADFMGREVGAPRSDRLWLAAASRGEGESWLGVVNASWGARATTPVPWEEEFARARLVARQWWGHSVLPRTPRDRWITEGLAAVSALSYLEARFPGQHAMDDVLERWREELIFERTDRARGRTPAAPIGLGNRSSSFEEADEYDRIITLKAAWAMQMLRARLTDPQTHDDRRFGELLREVYGTSDRRIGTDEFRRAAERHTGEDLGAFFEQWVYGTGIPRLLCAWRATTEPGGSHLVECRVSITEAEPGFTAPLDVRVDLGGGRTARDRIMLVGPKTLATLRPLPAAPRRVEFGDGSAVLGTFETVPWEEAK